MMGGLNVYFDPRYDEKGNFTGEEDEEFDEDKHMYRFSAEEIIKVDGRKGTYQFENEKGEKCTLTKEVTPKFDYGKYL